MVMDCKSAGVAARLRRHALALTAALALCAASHGAASAQEKVKLRIAYIPVITWLPAMVAKDEGLFDKNGLDVEMTKFPNIINLPGTLGKQFDMVPTTAPDLLNAAAHGLNIAAVSGETIETANNKSFQVLVRADSGIQSPKDLSGKRVASPGIGSVMHIALLYWVKKDGGDPSGINGVETSFPAMIDQLKAGRVDAVEQLEPFVGQMLGMGFKSIGDPLLTVADPVLFPFWIADATWARAHRDVLKKWAASLEAALAVIKSDDKKARAVLAKYSGLPDAVVARIPIPAYDFKITPAQLDVWRQMMVSQGYPLDKLDIDKLVVTPE
jgi:ABC-type nitrate/sulfonate/bicarbonate transport system substrate-binding protein